MSATKEAMMAAQDLEGYDEIVQRFLELLSPKQRAAGLSLEERLEGLAPEERFAVLLPALPDEVLRVLPDAYVASLPEPTREAIRKRLGR